MVDYARVGKGVSRPEGSSQPSIHFPQRAATAVDAAEKKLVNHAKNFDWKKTVQRTVKILKKNGVL